MVEMRRELYTTEFFFFPLPPLSIGDMQVVINHPQFTSASLPTISDLSRGYFQELLSCPLLPDVLIGLASICFITLTPSGLFLLMEQVPAYTLQTG